MTSSYNLLNKKIHGILDSIFIISNKPVSVSTIAKLIEKNKKETIEILKEYMKYFNSVHEGVKIRNRKDFYYLSIEDDYLDIAKRYMKPPPLTDRQRILLAYVYQKKEIPQRELSKVFGPNVYKDLKKLRNLGFISIVKRKNVKTVIFRSEAEAYIIKKKGREKLKT